MAHAARRKEVFWRRHRDTLILAALTILIAYFLLPYLLPLLGIGSFVIKSNSMTHPDHEEFLSFWTEHGVAKPPLQRGFAPGDVVIVRETPDIAVGDVVLFSTSSDQATHRVFLLNETHFLQLGDKHVSLNYGGNLTRAYEKAEEWLPRERIRGRVIFSLPRAGALHFWLRCRTGSQDFC